MANKAQVQLRADKLGVTLRDDGEVAYIEAPSSMQFSATHVAYLDIYYNSPPGAWRKSDAWDALLKEMHMGVEPAIEDSEYWD